MNLHDLANELLVHVFWSCASVHDVLALAATSRRLHRVFSSSQKLPILFRAVEAQHGPLQDMLQLVTHNASQPAHHVRSAPHSQALLEQVHAVGRVAAEWADIYPPTKWRHDFENRRALTADETRRLRRAVYRLWLYSRAFHDASHGRTARLQRQAVVERAALLHNWSSEELAEVEDVRLVVREVIQSQICPSNGTARRRFKRRFPGAGTESAGQLLSLMSIHLNYPPPTSSAAATAFTKQYLGESGSGGRGSGGYGHSAGATANNTKLDSLRAAAWRQQHYYEPTDAHEGWGDDISHYYVVEDMLKLDPAAVLWLREHAAAPGSGGGGGGKGMVQAYVRDLGEWFENNGETFGQTLDFVLAERAEDVEEFREGIEGGTLGVGRW